MDTSSTKTWALRAGAIVAMACVLYAAPTLAHRGFERSDRTNRLERQLNTSEAFTYHRSSARELENGKAWDDIEDKRQRRWDFNKSTCTLRRSGPGSDLVVMLSSLKTAEKDNKGVAITCMLGRTCFRRNKKMQSSGKFDVDLIRVRASVVKMIRSHSQQCNPPQKA